MYNLLITIKQSKVADNCMHWCLEYVIVFNAKTFLQHNLIIFYDTSFNIDTADLYQGKSHFN